MDGITAGLILETIFVNMQVSIIQNLQEVYPNKETQMQFLSAYAKEEMKLQASVDSEPGSPEFFDKLERLYVEVNRYALGSHLFWGVWGIIQAKHSKSILTS